MTIKVGDKVPSGALAHMTADGPAKITTDELFSGKKVALFALPGAFTPTCSAKHVPGFLAHHDALIAKGVDTVACLSVNDAFVMGAWGKDQGVGDKILMLADGNADYADALGLSFDASGFGMGKRAARFAMVVDDGTVTLLNVEEPGAFEVSSAEAVLAAL
jgi:peroxiredoxin|tara:strand:- start:2622 stop:3104 length:483 start_codon:yes stop_codon:yes gene_type:complete